MSPVYLFEVFLLFFLHTSFIVSSSKCNKDLAVYKPVYHKSKRDKALLNYVIKTIKLGKFDQCLAHCIIDCRCVSINLKNDKSECELNDARKKQDLKNFVTKRGNIYQELRCVERTKLSICNEHCCNKNYCLHGGRCVILRRGSKRRFHCICLRGYTGNLCQHMQNCAAILQSNRNSKSGIYSIHTNSTIFKAYCDMDLTNNQAWTMVTSYSLANKNMSIGGFMVDMPGNETTPNFNSYRLSLSEMQGIGNTSMLWRATCQFDKGVDIYEQDFVIGRFEDLNLFQVNHSKTCSLVKVINVRGIQCKRCTAAVNCSPSQPHFVSVEKSNAYCSFKINNGLQMDYEQAFGQYKYYKISHRCSENQSATTQWWFGSDLQ